MARTKSAGGLHDAKLTAGERALKLEAYQRGRRCHAKNGAGKPCGAMPMRKGTIINDFEFSGDYCRSHEPGISESAKLQQSRPGVAGKPKGIRTIENEARQMFFERLAAEFPALLEKELEIAAEATKHVVVQGTRDQPGYTEEVPHQELRHKAIQDLFDRLLGKAKSTAEITGTGGEPIVPRAPTRERIGKAADLLEQVGATHAGRQRRNPAKATDKSAVQNGD